MGLYWQSSAKRASLGLCKSFERGLPYPQVRMRGKAARALLRYTKTAVQDLQHDEDEMLRGALPDGFTLVGVDGGAFLVPLLCA